MCYSCAEAHQDQAHEVVGGVRGIWTELPPPQDEKNRLFNKAPNSRYTWTGSSARAARRFSRARFGHLRCLRDGHLQRPLPQALRPGQRALPLHPELHQGDRGAAAGLPVHPPRRDDGRARPILEPGPRFVEAETIDTKTLRDRRRDGAKSIALGRNDAGRRASRGSSGATLRPTPRICSRERRILAPARLVPVTPEVGRPYYQAETALQVLDLREAPESGSTSSKWWTRSQPIRTLAQVPFQFPLLGARRPFAYQHLSGKAVELQRLGMSASAIARALGVTDKTITKALSFASRTMHNTLNLAPETIDDRPKTGDYRPDRRHKEVP